MAAIKREIIGVNEDERISDDKLFLKSVKKDLKNNLLYFVGLENFKFRRKVIPGDILIMKMEFIVPIKRGLAKMKGEVYVGEELVCEGILTAIVGKK